MEEKLGGLEAPQETKFLSQNKCKTRTAREQEETWRDCVGYEGIYAVSDQGNVKSFVYDRCGRLLVPFKQGSGYLYVDLGRDNTRPIHQLVAEAFIGPRPPDYVTLHLNHDRVDNRLANIRWGTRSENMRDRPPRQCLTTDKVRAIKDRLAQRRRGDTQLRLGEVFGVSRQTISSIQRGLSHADVEVR
jgi:hypothetical protein